MIPVRIQLSGFLCYREPQEACFDGCTLWMLAGPNGSGKSALFDAVTFALFGRHRGGKRQNAQGLIHYDCDRLAIEYDFRLDDQLYRARRTLSRQGRSTRQILMRQGRNLQGRTPSFDRRALVAQETGAHRALMSPSETPKSSEGTEDGTANWIAVPETHTERGFARWIDANIALSYETFTASVLLLQGRADNLLLATPLQRHRLLCQVVGPDTMEQIYLHVTEHRSVAGRGIMKRESRP